MKYKNIERVKEIEKLEYEMDSVVVYTAYGPQTSLFPKNKLLVDKLNELIEAVNNLNKNE